MSFSKEKRGNGSFGGGKGRRKNGKLWGLIKMYWLFVELSDSGDDGCED